MIDEPVFSSEAEDDAAGGLESDDAIVESIDALLRSEKFAVLSTQGEGQPYASLVAFASTEDLKAAVFATAVTTRKYRLLRQCDRVALQVDNRSRYADDMMAVESITATGRAIYIDPASDSEREVQRWSRLLLARHPQLSWFVRSPTCALFRIEIFRYFHVSRFQVVRQWIPGNAS